MGRIIKSVSYGFVTNSSSYVTTILVNRKKLLDKLNKLDEKTINEYIDKYFNDFIKNDVKIYYTDIYEDFIAKVKKSIHNVTKRLQNFAKSKKDDKYLIIESDCNIQGNGIDIDKPEPYALWFIIKYILSDIAESIDENYV